MCSSDACLDMHVSWIRKEVTMCFFSRLTSTAILVIFEGWFQVFQLLFSSKLVLKTVEICFVTLNYHENGSIMNIRVEIRV
jgi:hypothetical protein